MSGPPIKRPRDGNRAGEGKRDSKSSGHYSGRRPPAYQEYGSDLLGFERVRLMSLAERGLLATLRWHIWVNDTIPREPAQLARLLGLQADEVREALTDRVLSFFLPVDNEPERLYEPELAAQMAVLLERRDKQAEGGRYAARTRKRSRIPADGNRHGEHHAPEKSGEGQSRGELARAANEPLPEHRGWVEDYDKTHAGDLAKK